MRLRGLGVFVLLPALLLGCWSRVRQDDGEGLTIRRTLVARCTSTTSEERIFAQLISTGSGGCIEDLFSDEVLGAAECESFERRLAETDCTTPGRPVARHLINLRFDVDPGGDLPAARFAAGTWSSCEDLERTERTLTGNAFFTPRSPPQLVLGHARLHGVVRPRLCSDVRGQPWDSDVPADTDPPIDTGRFDTGR